MIYRADLDGLRAVAVLAVVVYHLFPAAASGGYVGVDVFFVLSGFLITALTLRRIDAGDFSLTDFYARRARRLLPAVFVVLAACAVAGQLLYGATARADLGKAIGASALYAANLHFYAGLDYFSAPLETQPLLHLWSLGVEEQFYLFAPLLLVALARRRRLLFGSLVVLVVLSLIASGLALRWDPQAAFYLPPFRAWELGLGALLAFIPTGWRAPRGSGWVGGMMLLASIFVYDHGTPFPGPAALLPTLATALILVAGPEATLNRLLSWRPLTWLGRRSYALYLWHWPVLTFGAFLLMRRPTVGEAVGLGLLSLGLAAASYRWVETPLRTAAPTTPQRWVLARAGLATLAGAGLGWAVYMAGREPHHPRVEFRSLAEQLAEPTTDCARVPGDDHPTRICRFGDPEADADVLVFGDSHVSMVGGVMSQLGEAAGQNGMVAYRWNCPPIFGLIRRDQPVYHRCDAFTQAMKERIADETPETVVLIARWPLHLDGTRYGDQHKRTPRFEQAGSDGRPADVHHQLGETIAWLQDSGSQVVVVNSVPEVSFDVTSTLDRAERLGLDAPSGPTLPEFAERNATTDRLLRAAAEHEAVRLVHPSEALCGPARCRIAEGGEPLYEDDNHLTALGAQAIAAVLGDAMAPRSQPGAADEDCDAAGPVRCRDGAAKP